jgi:hypothetical protein
MLLDFLKEMLCIFKEILNAIRDAWNAAEDIKWDDDDDDGFFPAP